MEPVYYSDYLALDRILNAQKPKTGVHDETLFIIVHQVYEMWFKQILRDLASIQAVFAQKTVAEGQLLATLSRLDRIKKIQGLLLGQMDVMETLSPMDFVEFRDHLMPASGFQSVQFRKLEIRLGLSTQNRQKIDRRHFLGMLNRKDRQEILELEKEPCLFSLVEKWLERLPFVKDKNFDFWREYEKAFLNTLARDRKTIEDNRAELSAKAQEAQTANLEAAQKTFESLFDKEKHQELLNQGACRLSREAFLNALFIFVYRDEPLLHAPYLFLTSLMELDENLALWRYRHALMAQRLLGDKIGTGGSSGHAYLKMTIENNRVYTDLFNISTFLVPKEFLPKLPANVLKSLNF